MMIQPTFNYRKVALKGRSIGFPWFEEDNTPLVLTIDDVGDDGGDDAVIFTTRENLVCWCKRFFDSARCSSAEKF